METKKLFTLTCVFKTTQKCTLQLVGHSVLFVLSKHKYWVDNLLQSVLSVAHVFHLIWNPVGMMMMMIIQINVLALSPHYLILHHTTHTCTVGSVWHVVHWDPSGVALITLFLIVQTLLSTSTLPYWGNTNIFEPQITYCI